MGKIITHEDIVERLFQVNPNIEIAEQYHGMLSKTRFHCLIHDYYWETQVNHILEGHNCPKCAGHKMRTNKEFQDEVYAINSDIEIIGEYTLYETPVKCRCLVCDNVWNPYPSVLLRGGSCPKCAWKNNGLKIRNTHDYFIQKMEKNNPDIEVLGKYVHDKAKVQLRCKKCNFKWSAVPNNISNKNHTGCPHCNFSKGEIAVEKYLQENCYNYCSQYTFEDLKHRRFDFAIFDNFNSLLCLIEYDGKQHFEPVDFAGCGDEWAFERFSETQKGDIEKNLYCAKNNIKLIRIPYYANINTILESELGVYGSG